MKLANKAGSNTEKGTLAPIFALLKISSELMSNVHFHTVQKVQDLVKEISKYNEELYKKQKVVSIFYYCLVTGDHLSFQYFKILLPPRMFPI